MSFKESIENIRRYATDRELTRWELAKRAGLGRTTLRRMWRDDWKPSGSTLEKLEALIEQEMET